MPSQRIEAELTVDSATRKALPLYSSQTKDNFVEVRAAGKQLRGYDILGYEARRYVKNPEDEARWNQMSSKEQDKFLHDHFPGANPISLHFFAGVGDSLLPPVGAKLIVTIEW